MAHKRRKKSKGKKILVGVTSAVLLTGVAAGAILALDRAEVFASESEKEEPGVSENEELEAKIAELEASKTELQAKLTALTSDKENLKSEVADLEKTIVDNQASIGSLTGQIETLDEEITSLRAEKLVLEENAEANESKIEELNSSIEDLEKQKAELETSNESKESEITELSSTIATLNSEKTSLEQSNATNQSRIEELNTSIESLEDEKTSLQEQLTEKENIITSLNSQVTDLESQISSLNSQIDELNQGEYKLIIDNPEIDITLSDYNKIYYDRDYSPFTDIHSSFSGEDIDYQVIVSSQESEYIDGVGVKIWAYMYYFNGSADNGDYAVRVLNIDNSFSQDVKLYYNDESLDYGEMLFMDAGEVLQLDNFSATKNTYLYDNTLNIYNIQIENRTTGANIYLKESNDVSTFTLEEDTQYYVVVHCRNASGNTYNIYFYITTKTGTISSLPSGYTFVSENWDSEGNYVVNLLDTNNEEMSIKIEKEYFTGNSNLLYYVSFSEGYSCSSSRESSFDVTLIFNDENGNSFEISFYLDKLAELREYYLANFA